MATGNKVAAISCPICLGEYQSRLKVLSCGHVLCEGCLGNIEKIREQKGKCPYCKASYKKDVITLYPDLVVVDPSVSTNEILQRTRQRVIHVVNHLGIISSAEEIREAYDSAREHRALIRNAATGCSDPNFETLTLAVTDAVDSLEERLHYSLQKQDLINSISDMKRRLRSSAAIHQAEQAALTDEVQQLKMKFRHEEKERKKNTTALESYKERLHTSTLEKNTLSKRVEEQAAQTEVLQKQLEATKNERGIFQGQLEEYRKKALKQRALVLQLKQEIEELKAKPIDRLPKTMPKPVAPKASAPSFPIRTWPFVPPPGVAQLPGSPSFIDLCSTSSPRPTASPSPRPGAGSRKRPRVPDENENYPILLSPPKVRAAGPSRPRNEVIEMVAGRSSSEIRRWAASVKPKVSKVSGDKSVAPKAAGQSSTRPSAAADVPQLSLGQGKLLGVMKKRKVRAV